jgi:hypothetical protein
MSITDGAYFGFRQLTNDTPTVENLSFGQAATVTGGAAAAPANPNANAGIAVAYVVGAFLQAGVAMALGIDMGWPVRNRFQESISNAYDQAIKNLKPPDFP